MVTQLFSNPNVLMLSAAVLGLLGLVPGMPNFVFLLFTAALLGLAWWLRGREAKPKAEPAPIKMPETPRRWKPPGMTSSWKIRWGWRWAIA